MTENHNSSSNAEWNQRQLKPDTPIFTISGIVDASGVRGGQFPGDEHWNMSLTFAAWRTEGDDVISKRLNVRREVTHEELRSFMNQISQYSVLRIRAHLIKNAKRDEYQAQLVEIVGLEESDTELNELAIHLQKPVTFKDSFFGTFTLDRRINWYQTETTWKEKPIELQIPTEKTYELEKALEIARSLWQSQDKWDERIRRFAIHELLPLKNDVWIDEDEVEVTPEQFNARMKLKSVTVYSDGQFEFWHDDGDLFFGHAILIDGNITDGPTYADIPG